MNDLPSSMKADSAQKTETVRHQPNANQNAKLASTDADSGKMNGHSPAKALLKSVEKTRSQENNSSAPNWLTWLIGKTQKSSAKVREDLEDAIATETLNSDGFSVEEKTLINNVLRLHEIRIEDVMIARAEMEAVDITATLGELMLQFESSGHSRMPAYSETLDDPRGMVHIRDVVGHITRFSLAAKSRNTKLAEGSRPNIKNIDFEQTIDKLELVREVLFVPPSMLASDLMEKMQANRIQMALVIDEYGGTDGLVSLEDLVEVIVGDIEDEHDVSDADMIKEMGEGVYRCDARAELEDIVDILGKNFKPGKLGEDVDTIGGLIFEITGRIPVRGEVIEALGYEFRILEADPRRICAVEIAPVISQN